MVPTTILTGIMLRGPFPSAILLPILNVAKQEIHHTIIGTVLKITDDAQHLQTVFLFANHLVVKEAIESVFHTTTNLEDPTQALVDGLG